MNIIFNNKILAFILLLLILFTAFYLRINSNSFDLIDSDSFYHARLTEYILKDGVLPKIDPLAYYSVAGGTPVVEAGFLWSVTAILYKLVYVNSGFDFNRFYSLLLVFPVIFGLIAVLLIYLISSDLFGQKVGLVSAFSAAILPSLIYRTSAGFFEDENIGVVLMLLSFFVYFKLLKENDLKRKLVLSALIGTIIALMSLTWKAYLIIPLIILAQSCVGQLLISLQTGSLNKIRGELLDYSKSSFLILTIIVLGIFFLGQNLFKDISFYLMLGGVNLNEWFILALFVISLICSTLFSLFLLSQKAKFKEFLNNLVPYLFYCFWIVLGLVLYIILSKSILSINMFVFEELPGTLFFFEQNGLMLIPISLSLFILPFYISKLKLNNNLDKLFLFFILTASFFMAAYQVKHMLLFGAIAPLGFGFLLSEVFKINKSKINFNFFKIKFGFDKILFKNLFLFLILVILVVSLFSSFGVVKNIESVTQKLFGVKEASIWLNSNSDSSSKIFSWWDAGHLITFFAEKRVVCDNRNYFGQLSEINKSVAEFFITPDVNKAFSIIKGYDSDYLVIYPQLFTQMRVLTAYSQGPKNALDSRVISNYYGFCDRIDSNIICDGKVLVDLRENKSDYWIDEPNSLIGDNNYYFYLGEDFYFMLDEKTNNSNLAKIFFESSETSKYYKKVYSVNGTRIFKVLK